MSVQPFSLDNQEDADSYLSDLLKRPEYRSITEIEYRACKYIKDPALRDDFISKGRAALAA